MGDRSAIVITNSEDNLSNITLPSVQERYGQYLIDTENSNA